MEASLQCGPSVAVDTVSQLLPARANTEVGLQCYHALVLLLNATSLLIRFAMVQGLSSAVLKEYVEILRARQTQVLP